MRSWLYVPGNNPKMIVQAGIYGADGLVFDLEDSVRPDKKGEARTLVAEAFRDLDFGATPAAVRINGIGTGWWKDDLKAVIPRGIRHIRLPKTEGSEEVNILADEISGIERDLGLKEGVVKIQCILETPRGIKEAFNVAGSSPRIESLSFGAEDYCTCMGIDRKGPPFVLDYPRSRIANAAAVYGLEAADTVWADFNDSRGLEEDSFRARQLGFSGKSVIHPDQIEIVNRIFSVSGEEIEWARKVLSNSSGKGTGSFSLDGSMIDLPVIRRAERIMDWSGLEDPEEIREDGSR